VVHRALQVFEVPLATAAVLALIASVWIYPLAPPFFLAALGVAGLVPAIIILRRLIERPLFPILYAMVIADLVDQVRYVTASLPLLARAIFLLELVAVCLFLLWLLRSRRLGAPPSESGLLERGVRIYAGLALAVLCVAGLINALGYTHLSYLVGHAMLASSYLAVIFYAVVRIGDGLIVSAMKIRPFSLLGMVHRHFQLLASNASTVLRWLVFFLWIWETLDLFSIRASLWSKGAALLTYPVTDLTGHVHLELSLLGRLPLFAFTIWMTFLLSRFVRFILEEEVYPHLKLAPGVPYAASTMVHYAVLIVGCLTGVSVLGVDLSKYAVLVGALGVGLGFGLQNIINNFVSGIILLFERPIKVGDVIQVDTAVGTVESIGIRASVVRITNGSEIIVPNGNLISNQVTNWTFSNRQRVIDVSIAVAPKSDPQRVMVILADAAKAHSLILKDPTPQVLFTGLTGTALNFELRAWTTQHEVWTQIRSDLFLAISAALAKENIEMSTA